MIKTQSKKFIDYLDSYSLSNEYKYLDYSILTTAINDHFDKSKLEHKNMIGSKYKHIDFSSNVLNNEVLEYRLWSSSYSIWQKQHEELLLKPEEKKHFLTIDSSANTLSDIINLIKNNEYKHDTEYNIDLKSLHNIKDELEELNNMVGMENMKSAILDQLIYFIQDLHIGNKIGDFKHTVLFGSPGTGKTEVAKIIGKMYSKIGILKNNIFKKVTRNDLIAGYLGQTALKTKKVIDECAGGVLFIDEAYSLANSDREDSYSKECLDILCESLSDRKNDLMVIIAGYEDELNNTFFRANKGLESRFIWRFTMDPYNAKELMQIFKKKVKEQEWCFENESNINEKWFHEKKDNFKNYGRDMELLLTYTKISHGKRIYGKDKESRKKISIDDMNKGYEHFCKNQTVKKESVFMHGIYV